MNRRLTWIIPNKLENLEKNLDEVGFVHTFHSYNPKIEIEKLI